MPSVTQAQLSLFDNTGPAVLPTQSPQSSEALDEPVAKAGRQLWSVLLRKTFALDVTVCVVCGGRMRLLEFATTAEAVARELWRAGLGRSRHRLHAAHTTRLN